jgi:hypothetical protein
MHAHFDRAQYMYEKRSYAEAIHDFDAAYVFKASASLLYNVAVCREKLGDSRAAAATCRRYLAESPLARDRKPIEQRLLALESVVSTAN